MTNEEARALVERLKNYAEHPSSFTDISPTEADAAADLIEALLAERDSFEALWRSTMDVLEAERKERDSAVLAEREACAKVCDVIARGGGEQVADTFVGVTADACASAIRARSER